jgi:hypothetical protein
MDHLGLWAYNVDLPVRAPEDTAQFESRQIEQVKPVACIVSLLSIDQHEVTPCN